ncbi:MAG: hypothetical protein AB1649_18960 [Chloroflexota bacterium]
MKRFRYFLGIIILVASLALLIWSYWPVPRETRVQPISPSEMQLPTPEALRFDEVSASFSLQRIVL